MIILTLIKFTASLIILSLRMKPAHIILEQLMLDTAITITDLKKIFRTFKSNANRAIDEI